MGDESSRADGNVEIEGSADLVAEVLAAGGDVAFIAASGSMRPLIEPGSRVVVRRCTPADLRVGDVVVMASVAAVNDDGRRIVHRILGRRTTDDCGPTRFHTKGDAAHGPGEWVTETGMVGRVSRVATGAWAFDLSSAAWHCIGRAVAWLSAREAAAAAAREHNGRISSPRSWRERAARLCARTLLRIGIMISRHQIDARPRAGVGTKEAMP